MSIVHFGKSISTACAIILSLIVTMNTYNLTLASFNYDDYMNRIISSDQFNLGKRIIQLQSVLSILAIMHLKEYTSSAMNLIKFWIYGPLLMTLLFEMVLTIMSAFCSLREQILDEPEETIELKDEVVLTSAPETSYFFVGAMLFYFVFKLYAAIILLQYASIFIKRIGALDNPNETHLINDNDVESNESHPPTPPPRYEQCVLEFSLPPPYSEVHKY